MVIFKFGLVGSVIICERLRLPQTSFKYSEAELHQFKIKSPNTISSESLKGAKRSTISLIAEEGAASGLYIPTTITELFVH